MDLFTQNMINRTKLRQEQMSKTKQNSGTSLLCGNNQEEELKPSISMSKNVNHEKVSAQENCGQEKNAITGKENSADSEFKKFGHVHGESAKHEDEASPVKSFRKNRLEALADRINDWEDESRLTSKPITSTPEKVVQHPHTPTKFDNRNTTKSASKLVQLAESNQIKGKPFPTTKNKVSFSSIPIQKMHNSKALGVEDVTSPIKSVLLDKSVLQSLESQGYTPTESRSRLIFEFEKEQENEVEEETAKSWTFTATPDDGSASPINTKDSRTPKQENTSSGFKTKNQSSNQASAGKQPTRLLTSGSSPRLAKSLFVSQSSGKTSKSAGFPNSPVKQLEPEKFKKSESRTFTVQELAAQFESPRSTPKDPIEMTILERKALFERNWAKENHSNSSKISFSSQSPSGACSKLGMKEKSAATSVVVDPMIEETQRNRTSYNTYLNSSSQTPKDIQLTSSPSIPNFKKADTNQSSSDVKVGQCEITDKITADLEKTGAEPYAGVHQVRPIRVSPPKPGKLYPCLSDIESVTENESDADEQLHESVLRSHNAEVNDQDLDSSFTIEILGRAGLSQYINTPKRKLQEMQPEVKENLSNEDLSEISNLLDEALDGSEQSVSPKHPKREEYDHLNIENETFAASLYHSVTSYRQQKEKTCTPVKQIVRNREISRDVVSEDAHVSNEHCDEVSIQQQIRSLQEEISVQQNVMAQACQALNLCRATAEFSGSTEQVEGEKLLLISSQKRNSAINEIQRLKTEAAMKVAKNLLASRGTLSFSNIGLPLKKEFLAMLPKGGGDIVHYFIVLIRSRGQVIPLQMLSTADGIQDGVLLFPNLVQLSNLSPDFEVTIEVYALQTRKEKMNHEAKYHIRKESSKMRLTPKKLANKQDNRGISKMQNSSANLRGSSFGLVGVSNITPITLQKRNWTLENVPSTSPIDGKLQLKIQSHSESLIKERGFLTVFEDIGGFGAWHRRWCLLSNDQLLFWKYPDDERLKEPQYVINLRKCITEHVDVVSNDICARPNTFLLVTVRPPENNDKDSLVMTRYSQRTAVRHLISADSKGERQLWCKQINRVLANLRVWDTETE